MLRINPSGKGGEPNAVTDDEGTTALSRVGGYGAHSDAAAEWLASSPVITLKEHSRVLWLISWCEIFL
jgi:hypothetical protein